VKHGASNERQVGRHAQLFAIRLWPEDLGAGRAEWRGEVRHLPSGETRYFREWSVLVAFLQAKLPRPSTR
jgi:hypothetical protein